MKEVEIVEDLQYVPEWTKPSICQRAKSNRRIDWSDVATAVVVGIAAAAALFVWWSSK